MTMIVVDGTGPSKDSDYAREMGRSFCSQIALQTGGVYFRGPSLFGGAVSQTATHVVDAALAGDRDAVRLAGYSRGGCTAIIAARRLRDKGVRVKALYLFDAVDMQVSDLHLSQIITDNVDYVAHARSARDLIFWTHNPVKSRFYFYNTGRWLAGSGQIDRRSFVGSHGALGGVPWSDVAGDQACAMAVGAWMGERLRDHGLAVTLKV
jgi:acetyl esterase/lipase